MQRNNEIVATAFTAAVNAHGGSCPECGVPANIENLDEHLDCLAKFQDDINKMVDKVVALLNEGV